LAFPAPGTELDIHRACISFPDKEIFYTPCRELNGSILRLIRRVDNPKARKYYLKESRNKYFKTGNRVLLLDFTEFPKTFAYAAPEEFFLSSWRWWLFFPQREREKDQKDSPCGLPSLF